MTTCRNVVGQLEKISREPLLRPIAEKITKISAALKEGLLAATSNTGHNLADAKIARLPDGVAGQYEIANRHITIDAATALSGDKRLIEHVATHEAFHAQNRARNLDGEQINDVKVEEALTEMATAEHTGQQIAYKEYNYKIDQITAAHKTTRRALVNLFKNGKNLEINDKIEAVN